MNQRSKCRTLALWTEEIWMEIISNLNVVYMDFPCRQQAKYELNKYVELTSRFDETLD